MRRAILALPLLFACASAPAPREAPSVDAAPAPEPEAAPDPLADAKKAAHFAGLDDRVGALASLPRIVEGSIRQAASRVGRALPPELEDELGRLRSASERTHAPESLRHRAVRALREGDPGGRAAAAAGYLEGESHQAVEHELQRVLSPAGQKALGAFLATLPTTPPDPERLARARSLVLASGEVDLMLALTYDASRAYLDAALKTLPAEARDAVAPHLAPREKEREVFRAKVQRSLVLQTYFATRYVEDRHVIRELAFWRSEVGQWLARSRARAVELALLESNQALLTAVAAPRDPGDEAR